MLFWIAAALLTVAASLAVLLPLGRRMPSAGGHDVEIYRDQLAELDRDAGRGLIGPSEAEEARAEIARRILKASSAGVEDRKGRFPRAAAAAAVLAVPIVSWGVYGLLGSPGVASQPLQARLEADPATRSIEELVARAERHLVENPADGRGWDVLAPIYLRLGRPAESVTAYRNALRLMGPSAEREAGLGEAIATAAGGTISLEAEQAFGRALALDPSHAKARFMLAAAKMQEGRGAEALEAWRALLADLPPDSPWRRSVEQAMAQAAAPQGQGGPPAPSGQDIEAAAAMSEGDRAEMVEGMVASLDERLRQNPRDVEGWLRLIRSYVVLGREDDARDALGRATTALGEGSPEARRVAELAASLGIASME